MAHQDIMPQLTEDQPPAYPYHDKPPDYHDVWPRTTVSPPPVDIPPPDSTPAVHIPLTTTNDVIFSPVYSSYATTTTTIAAATTTTTTTTTTSYRYPHENVVVTQSHTHNSHPNDVNEGVDWHDILWKILIVLSVIAAIIALPIGIHACIHSCVGYHSEDAEVQKRSAKIAIVMCTITYVAVTVVVIVVPVTLA